MNLLADESVDRQIVDLLRQDGHRVWYVAEMEPGLSDDEVLEKANQQSALLLTCDKDFGELVYRLGRINAGVVLVRLAGLSPARKAEIISPKILKHGAELMGSFTVISAGGMRIRAIQG